MFNEYTTDIHIDMYMHTYIHSDMYVMYICTTVACLVPIPSLEKCRLCDMNHTIRGFVL